VHGIIGIHLVQSRQVDRERQFAKRRILREGRDAAVIISRRSRRAANVAAATGPRPLAV
jgi:hypothetical protein